MQVHFNHVLTTSGYEVLDVDSGKGEILTRYLAIRQISSANVMFAPILFLAFLIGGTWFTTPVNAQSNSLLCRDLKLQLASVSRTTSNANSKKYRQYENAIRKQQLQIGKAKRAARRNGCASTRKSRSNQCRRIASSLKKMQANLVSLKRTKAKLSPNSSNSRKRQSIIRRLENNGCYTGNDSYVDAPDWQDIF